jgi:exonuclease SbcC
MAIKLLNISISNFKYIKSEKFVDLQINNNLTILKGPNGYGKSTIFDSIELLITGDIKHFNPNLKNRGQIDKNILANDSSKIIEIVGYFIDGIGNYFNIKRVFNSEDGFESKIYYNDEQTIINENKLLEILKINKNFF